MSREESSYNIGKWNYFREQISSRPVFPTPVNLSVKHYTMTKSILKFYPQNLDKIAPLFDFKSKIKLQSPSVLKNN